MERQTIIIELAGVPVAKGRARFVRSTGIAFTPAKTRSYESHLRLAAQEVMAGRAPLDGPLVMRVRVTLPIPMSYSKKRRAAALAGDEWPAKRPDVDNYSKTGLDALNAIVFRDDAQVVDLRAVKRYGERPSLQIEVGPVAGGLGPPYDSADDITKSLQVGFDAVKERMVAGGPAWPREGAP